MDILKSRRFWLLVIDFVAIVGGFVLRSYAPQYQDAIVLIVGAAQPLVMYLLAKFTEDDTVAKTIEALGKTVPLILLALILASVFGASSAVAAPPDYTYSLVQCSGLSLAELGTANQEFDSWYGWQRQLTTADQWQNSYVARVNEFSATLGCPAMLTNADGKNTAGVLTFAARMYLPWYRFYLSDYPKPE